VDTELISHSGLQGLWTGHANGTGPAFQVAVQLSLLEHILLHDFPCFESISMDGSDGGLKFQAQRY
jgi:hypothetical protein